MSPVSNPDQYFESDHFHKSHINILRSLLNSTELEERLKWGVPVYCLNNKNVVGIVSFKAYAGLWFYQGSFLKDESNVLVNAQDGKTRGMRQWRFGFNDRINEELVLKYVIEAIKNQKDGKEIKPARVRRELVIPLELQHLLVSDENIMRSFGQMRMSHKLEFVEYISGAKREETRKRRTEKVRNLILKGSSLNEKYN